MLALFESDGSPTYENVHSSSFLRAYTNLEILLVLRLLH